MYRRKRLIEAIDFLRKTVPVIVGKEIAQMVSIVPHVWCELFRVSSRCLQDIRSWPLAKSGDDYIQTNLCELWANGWVYRRKRVTEAINFLRQTVAVIVGREIYQIVSIIPHVWCELFRVSSCCILDFASSSAISLPATAVCPGTHWITIFLLLSPLTAPVKFHNCTWWWWYFFST